MSKTKFKIGHVLMKVNNLHLAVKEFEEKGFCVIYGSAPKRATNAMIYFGDGSFIELFSTTFHEPIQSFMRFLVRVMLALKHPYGGRLKVYTTKGEGLRDYALDAVSPSQFEGTIQWLGQGPLEIFGPRHMKRKNNEGQLISWSLYYPLEPKFPFFMSPYSPSIKSTDWSVHPNGITGFDTIVVVTTKWEEDLNWYKTVFEQNPEVIQEDNQCSCYFYLEAAKVLLTRGETEGISHVILKSEKGILYHVT